MALWPFKRRGNKSTIDSDSRPDVHLIKPETSQEVSQRSRKHGRRKQSNSQFGRDRYIQVKQLDAIKPVSPMDATFVRRRSFESYRSCEDITALPRTRQLKTSPRLRPLTKNDADIPYDFRLNSAKRNDSRAESPGDAPALKQRNRLIRTPSRRKKLQTNELPPKLSKKHRRGTDSVREEDLRVMSAPTYVPRGLVRHESGLLRRDSKKVRDGLNRNFERPISHISLPQADSGPSSRHGIVDGRSYRISVSDALNPRPIIRPIEQPYSMLTLGWTNPPSRSSSFRQAVSVGKQKSKASRLRRVDDLADDMDASDLRAIMDRDKRNAEKKKERDVERLKRRLEKRVEENQRKEEAERAGTTAELGRDTDVERPRKEGPDEERAARRRRSRRKKERAARKATEAKEIVDSDHQDPFRDPVDDNLEEREPSPLAPPRITPGKPEMGQVDVARPITPPALAVRTEPFEAVTSEQDNNIESIPRFPVFASSGSDIDETPLPSPISSSYPLKSALAPHLSSTHEHQQPTLLPSASPSTTALPTVPASPERRKRRPSLLFSFFRRGRKSRTNSSSEGEQELGTSFVNLSRDQMRGDLPPIPGSRAGAQPGNTNLISHTETLTRSPSRFHENLPEVSMLRSPVKRPPSPPSSRVASQTSQLSHPDAVRGAMATPVSHRRISEQSAYASDPQDGESDREGISPARQAHPFTQSLASIDSEGSWLTGKPIKRVTSNRSSALKGSQRNSNSHAESRASGRDSESDDGTEIADQDAQQRHRSLTEGTRTATEAIIQSNLRSPHKALSTDDITSKLDKKEGMKVHSELARRPDIKKGLRVKSSEGLLKEMLQSQREADGDEYEVDSNDEKPVVTKGASRHDSSMPNVDDLALEVDSDDSDLPTLQRATSVKTGKLLDTDAKVVDVSKRNSREVPSGRTTPRPLV